MTARLVSLRALVVLSVVAACSSGEYRVERRGGPFPTDPVVDEPLSGGGNGGTRGAEGGAAEPTTAGSGDGGADSDAALIPFCDALAVVQAKCQRCHGDPITNSAPVAFLTYEDFQAQYFDTELRWWEVAVNMVEKDLMPFVALNANPTLEGPPVEPLTVEEKATLLGWLEQGALPEGGTDCP